MTRLGKTAKAAYQKAFDKARLEGASVMEAVDQAWDACADMVLKERDRLKWEEAKSHARIFG